MLRRAFVLLLGCAAGLTVAIAVAGCLDDSRGVPGTALADPESAAGVPLSLATVTAAVQPDEGQAAVLSEALADLEERMDTLGAEREMRRRHESEEDLGPPPPHETLDPMDSFLSTVVPVLRPEQVESLVDVLVAGREARRAAFRASRAENGSHPDRSGHMARMAIELELTEEQKTQIAALLEETRDEIVAKRHADMEGGPPHGPEADASIRAKIGALLNDAQRAKFEARTAERREVFATYHEAREAEALDRKVSFLATSLSLDSAAEAAVRSALEQSGREREALLSSRGEGVDDKALRTSMKEIHSKTQAAIAALLTPDRARVFAALGRLQPGGPR